MSLFFGKGFLITGILSPVSILSFTMQVPEINTKSQGMLQFSGISITSPGTNVSLSTVLRLS